MHEEWGYQSEDLLQLVGVVMHEEWENQSEDVLRLAGRCRSTPKDPFLKAKKGTTIFLQESNPEQPVINLLQE